MSTLTTHPKGRILVIEDESKLAHFVEAELTYQGYQVLVASDEQTGLAMAQNTAQLPDLALVDWMLPSGSGLEVCRRLRALGLRIPVIMMTPKDGVPDRVASLDAGADDYVLKPFSIQDLLSRMQAHLQRPSSPPASLQLIFLDLALDPLNRTATRGSRLIELTAKEFDLLRYLMEHPRQVLSRQQILENVWGYEFMGDSNIIEVYIRYLRLKVEQEGEKRLIQTVRGVGYVLRD